MPGREPLRTDRGDPEVGDLARLDPGVFMPVDQPRLTTLRTILARAAWRFPAALEEMRLWTHPRSLSAPEANHAFYRPDDVVDESGDGGPVGSGEPRLLPPH
jgi:hypothetical protein